MNDASLLKKVHLKLMELRRQRAVASKHERLERQEKRTAFELFCDTARAEGYDFENNETHRMIVTFAWLLKNNEPVDLEDDEMERDHRNMDF